MDGSDQRISMTSASIFHLGCPNIVLDPARVANPYSSPLNHSVSMSFVKLSIFGTSFEVGFRLLSFIELTPDLRSPQDMSISNPLAWVSHLSTPSSKSRSPPPRRIRASMVRFPIVFPTRTPHMPYPVPQRINLQAHPSLSRKS